MRYGALNDVYLSLSGLWTYTTSWGSKDAAERSAAFTAVNATHLHLKPRRTPHHGQIANASINPLVQSSCRLTTAPAVKALQILRLQLHLHQRLICLKVRDSGE